LKKIFNILLKIFIFLLILLAILTVFVMSVSSEKVPELIAIYGTSTSLKNVICLKGATATKGEICEAIFENSNTPEKDNAYLKTLIYSLKRDLKRCGFENLLIVNNNAYSVDTRYLYCDYYSFLTGVADKASSYRCEFMNQYSWAEQYIFELENYY